MSQFYLFSRLPAELRLCIWELAMEPREVAVGNFMKRRSRTAPPSILHVCVEARSHLEGFYIKRIAEGMPPNHSLVNVEIDSVYCTQGDIRRTLGEIPRIQHLLVECEDSEVFLRSSSTALFESSGDALKTVTLIEYGYEAVDETWWMDWDFMMECWYYRDDPVTFYTKVIHLDDPNNIEYTKDNYLKLHRDWRRAHAQTLEDDPDYGRVSDSDSDVDAPWRWRTFCHIHRDVRRNNKQHEELT